MTKQDCDSTADTSATIAELLNRTNAEQIGNDPELRSLFWMLREGVIGRRHFEDMVARAVQG